jgi:hypothetical protein
LGVGLTILPCKKKIVEMPPRNSAGFCGGGQGLSWAMEPRREEEEEEEEEMQTTLKLENLKVRHNLGDLGIERRIILNWILSK